MYSAHGLPRFLEGLLRKDDLGAFWFPRDYARNLGPKDTKILIQHGPATAEDREKLRNPTLTCFK